MIVRSHAHRYPMLGALNYQCNLTSLILACVGVLVKKPSKKFLLILIPILFLFASGFGAKMLTAGQGPAKIDSASENDDTGIDILPAENSSLEKNEGRKNKNIQNNFWKTISGGIAKEKYCSNAIKRFWYEKIRFRKEGFVCP